MKTQSSYAWVSTPTETSQISSFMQNNNTSGDALAYKMQKEYQSLPPKMPPIFTRPNPNAISTQPTGTS